MKNTTNTDIESFRSRFNYLKAMFHQSPLSEAELSELKTLAKKLDPEMAKQIDENPELY